MTCLNQSHTASTPAYHHDLKNHFYFFTSTAGGPLPDGFVEGYSPEVRGNSTETTGSTSPRSPLKGVQEVIEAMKSFCNKELVQSVKGVFEFHLTGKEPGVWHLDLNNDAGKQANQRTRNWQVIVDFLSK